MWPSCRLPYFMVWRLAGPMKNLCENFDAVGDTGAGAVKVAVAVGKKYTAIMHGP